jgi:hypothetical protein
MKGDLSVNMTMKQATAQFSSFERLAHHELDYAITRLPFVILAGDQYRRSFEVHVKENVGDRREPFEVLMSLNQCVPIAVEVLRTIALDFYRANRLDSAPTGDAPGVRVRVTPRSYPVELG